ncbi:MAG: hypothetical protein RR689_00825, partial [Mucinivorans sp.]
DSSSTAQEVETVEAVEPIAAQLAAVPIVESADTTSALSLWAIIIEAILWGFAALLTPCVFPMVPMTVSFFLKGSANKARGRMNAMIYGLSIVALYTIPIAIIIGITYFGGGEAITADIFNWLATHWVPNILFFLNFHDLCRLVFWRFRDYYAILAGQSHRFQGRQRWVGRCLFYGDDPGTGFVFVHRANRGYYPCQIDPRRNLGADHNDARLFDRLCLAFHHFRSFPFATEKYA